MRRILAATFVILGLTPAAMLVSVARTLPAGY